MCLVIILLAACSGLGATVSTASSAPDFVFVPTSGPCLTNNGGQPTVPYYNDIVVSKAVSRDPEPGETHIPGHGPEVETIEACLAACLERNVHVVSVNFLQGRECMCSGGCPCFEPLGGGWLVALPANCQHQQPQVCQDSESNGGWEPRGNRSSCMGFFDNGGHPVDDTKMSHPWGKASFAHCHQPFSWRQMNKNMSKDVFKTGGLGTLMEMDGYETWVCLHSSIIRPHWNPRCPHTGLVATVDPWFCWVYHETREEFTPWGPNSRVKLFDPPPVKDPIRSPDGRFVLVDMPMTWEEARTYCRTHFADLVSIHSSLVNSIVASLCEKATSVNGAGHGDTGIACWIGGYRSMSSQGLDLWAWSDGSAFDFTSWSEGEPNNMGSHREPYIHMWRGGERVDTWNDNGAGFEAGATVCSASVQTLLEMPCPWGGGGRASLHSPCSGNGVCANGTCTCLVGWQGDDCSKLACPSDCSGHGICQEDATCLCDQGWDGAGCATPICPNGCSGQGACTHNGTCICYIGFEGEDCSILADCSKRGTRECGFCKCDPGYYGDLCEQDRCEDSRIYANMDKFQPISVCSGHGKCSDYGCLCDAGFSGHNCSAIADCSGGSGAVECNGHGTCSGGPGLCQGHHDCPDQCTCDQSHDVVYSGAYCASAICPGPVLTLADGSESINQCAGKGSCGGDSSSSLPRCTCVMQVSYQVSPLCMCVGPICICLCLHVAS